MKLNMNIIKLNIRIYSKMSMLKAERQAKILQEVRKNGFIQSEKLIEQFNVSHVTIRRDLIALADQNLIHLEHGGATSIDYLGGVAEPLYDTKVFVHSEAKSEMADAALELIKDGDILILDAGTTNFKLAEKLKAVKMNSLTVITSDLMVAKELSPHPNFSVNVLGGILRRSYYNVFGPFTEMILSKLKSNKVFLGFDGASITRGLSLNILEEVPVKQKMIDICDEVIAFGDSSKYGVEAPYNICGWESVHRVIVDNGISRDYINFFNEKNIICNVA